MSTAQVIVLNGASCAGKSTLARAIQEEAAKPFIVVSLDQFRDSLPNRLRGLNSKVGEPGHKGLNIVPINVNGEVVTDIQFGEYGRTVLRGMRRSVALLAREGVNVIVDDLILDRSSCRDYVEAFVDLDVLFVAVQCDLSEMIRREQTREGRFPGTVKSTLAKVHLHLTYDLEVDTTSTLPKTLARRTLEKLDSERASPAIIEMREDHAKLDASFS